MHDLDTTADAAVITPRRTRGRKIRAILAGGLVLGVGAAVTLAFWTDNEYATGTFSAGTFNLEGSTASATTGFADHNAATGAPGTPGTPGGPAALTFTTPVSNLSPNTTVYSPFWLRLAVGTTSPANLRLAAVDATAGTPTDASGALTWSIYALATGQSCNAAGVAAGAGATLLQTSATLSDQTFTGGPNVALTQGASGTAGTAAPVCFVVTAGPSLPQSSSASATWQFTATSTI